jgi:hypothetical protein
MDLMMMERVGDRWGKIEGSCSTGQSPQWAVVPVEEEEGKEEEEEEEEEYRTRMGLHLTGRRTIHCNKLDTKDAAFWCTDTEYTFRIILAVNSDNFLTEH